MSNFSDVEAYNRRGRIAQLVYDKASSDTVPRRSSQLASVAHDIATSVCEVAGAGRDSRFDDKDFLDEFVETQSDRIRDILIAIPSGFHNFLLETKDGKDVNPFDLLVPALNETVKDIAEMEPKQVVNAFGTLWTHARALDEVQSGEKSKSHRDLCLHADGDGLSYVARLYLESDDFVSPFLEWALVDALVYWRILDFATSRKFSGLLPTMPQGQMIDGPLLPGTGSSPMGSKLPSVLGILGQGAAEIAANLTIEAVLLAATWGISVLLAGSEGLAKWVLFTGATAARWIAAAVKGKGNATREREAKEQTNLQMLWDMGIAHERVPAMNVGLLKHLLYRLEERGAGFNPAVYAILDKRAGREQRRG